MDVAIEKADRGARVRLVGRFDIKSNLEFRNAVRPLLTDDEVITITLDFAQVPFMDSSALGMLLLLLEQTQGANKRVVLTRCGPDLQRVLSVAQFHRIFRIE